MMKDILGSPNQQKLTSLGESMRHLTWLRDGGSCWPEEQRHQPLTGGDRQEQQEDEDGDQPLEGGEHLHRRPTYSTNFTTKIQKICVSDTSIIYSSCSSQHYNLCFRSGSTKSRNRTEARLEDWAYSVSEVFFKVWNILLFFRHSLEFALHVVKTSWNLFIINFLVKLCIPGAGSKWSPMWIQEDTENGLRSQRAKF